MPPKYRNRWKSTPEIEAWRYNYKASILGEVLTLPEVCLIFNKARQTVDDAVIRRDLEARLSITGGATLVTLRSCVALWGAIPDGIMPQAAREAEQPSLFDLEQLAEKHAPYKGKYDERNKS